MSIKHYKWNVDTWPPRSQNTSFVFDASIRPILSPTVGTIRSGGRPSTFEYWDFNFSSNVYNELIRQQVLLSLETVGYLNTQMWKPFHIEYWHSFKHQQLRKKQLAWQIYTFSVLKWYPAYFNCYKHVYIRFVYARIKTYCNISC